MKKRRRSNEKELRKKRFFCSRNRSLNIWLAGIMREGLPNGFSGREVVLPVHDFHSSTMHIEDPDIAELCMRDGCQ
jgi:hypothetical protein